MKCWLSGMPASKGSAQQDEDVGCGGRTVVRPHNMPAVTRPVPDNPSMVVEPLKDGLSYEVVSPSRSGPEPLRSGNGET
jgi:hypothetical protein